MTVDAGAVSHLGTPGVRAAAFVVALLAAARARTSTGRPCPGPGSSGEQPGSEETMVYAAGRGGFQRLTERSVAQDGTGTEQPFDHRECPGDISVAEPLTHGGQRLRGAVNRVDGPQAGQWRSAEGHQELFATQLVRVVIDRRQHAVPQCDAVNLTAALDAMRIARSRCGSRTGGR